MDRAKHIKQALERVESIFRAKPEKARFTKGGRATLTRGLVCEYVEDGRTVVADMPEPFGGEGRALSPGGYARAGLSMCLAIGYAMRAAHRGVTLNKVEVDVACDTDLASLIGFPGIPAGYSEFRYSVRVESDAPEAEVTALLDEADERSPVLDAFRRAQRVVRSVVVTRPETV
jgi:uncharacterized OsmC-like protein